MRAWSFPWTLTPVVGVLLCAALLMPLDGILFGQQQQEPPPLPPPG
jgi:hypothetical protein